MGHDQHPPEQWDRVAAELKAYREYQRETWGDLDNEILGQYLAGELSGDAKSQVEAAFADHPDLLMLTELVRDVLVTPSPVTATAPVVKVEPAPVVLSFTAAKATRSPTMRRLRQWLPVAAAACVLIGLGSFLPNAGLLPQGKTDRGFGSDLASRGEDPPVEVVDVSLKPYQQGPGHFGKTFYVYPKTKDPTTDSLVATETALVLTYTTNRDNLGKTNPQTLESLNKLALLYEEVVQVNATTAEPPTNYYQGITLVANPSPPGGNDSASKDKGRGWEAQKVKESQKLFAFHGQCLPPTAIPVLLDGIEQNKDPSLRERCAQTLVRMGPAAQKEAVPLLTARLDKCQCPMETQALATVLADLGATQQSVHDTLKKMEKSGPTEPHKQAARQALARMNQPAFWAGVHDEVGLYKPATVTKINARLKKIAEDHGLVVVIETVPSLPSDRDTQNRYVQAWSRDRVQRTPMPRTLHVLVTQNPPAARIALDSTGDARRDECCSAPFARTFGLAIQERLKEHHNDQGLEEAVLLLEQKLQDKSKR